MMGDDILIGSFRKSSTEEVRVIVREFKGLVLVDARVFMIGGAMTKGPTKKGLAIQASQLGDLIPLLRKAHTRALQSGLI